MVLLYVQAINHTILSLDELKTHRLGCPETFGARCATNSNPYLKSSWCKEGGNTVTLMLLKLNMHANIPKSRTVANVGERKKHAHKLISTLPDIDGMLRCTAVMTSDD